MKEKIFFRLVLVAGAATMLAACTSESDNSPSAKISYESVAAAQQVPVTFGTYIGEQAITRATTGYVGNISDAATLQGATVEFGVFGFYTGEELYYNTSNGATPTPAPASGSAASATKPNFMYNQEMTYSGSAWTYNPIKYWPNDFNGTSPYPVDTQSTDGAASGTKNNYLSFFAYAPYIKNLTQTDATTIDGAGQAGATSGITNFSGNDYAGNPTVTYVIGNDGQNVDLLWGIYNASTGQNVLSAGTNVGGNVLIPGPIAGKANTNINMQKQKTAGKIIFDFKHALAKIGDITVDSWIDDVAATTGHTDIGAATRITVKSITIEDADGSMKNSGRFDLATGDWSNLTGTLDFSHQLNQSADVPSSNQWQLADGIREPAAPAALITSHAWNATIPTGVTEVAQTVYKTANHYPVVFIPGSTPKLTFVIDYFVRTLDPNLATEYSVVEQQITKTVTFGAPAALNTKYDINLHLGLTSVKFDVNAVSGWDGGTTQTVHLPINVN